MAARVLLLLLLVVAAVIGVPPGRAGTALGEDYDDEALPPDQGHVPEHGGEAIPDEEEATVPSPVVCPGRCVCRYDASPKTVDCSNRKFTAFPPVEEVPEDVEYLDLSDNQIRTVPRDLPAWERLEVLALAGNLLTDFPPRSLGGMLALEVLDLSRNKIASLRHVRPDRFISDNPVLQVLNMSGNGLQDLGHGSFQSLSSESLRVLDVSQCAVSSIDGGEALAALPALRVLRVNGNPLEQLPVLSTAKALQELDASACRLRNVHADVLRALPELTHLTVSRNPDLAYFEPPPSPTPRPDDPDQLAHLVTGPSPWSSSLRVLEAEDCALHDAAFLSSLPNVTEVRLRGNRIAALEPNGLLDNGPLQHLDLADNVLENLPADAFRGTEDMLKELDLSGNRLVALHAETFSQHAALRSLNVSRNPMASLLLSVPSLRILDASHAQLQLLAEGLLDGTPHLRHLNLSNNPLPSLPDRLASPGRDAALHTLDVSFCRLTDLSVTALDALPIIQALDLRGNRLTDPLKVKAFGENPVLHHIQLGDNPWRCDCKSKDFRAAVDFLLQQPAKEDLHSLMCHSPEAVQGQSWYDACLAPGRGSLASLEAWIFVVILVLCLAVVAIGVVTGRRLTRGKARRRRQRQQQQEEERRACEQEAARRRLHRRMQQDQQDQLRRQSMRAQAVSTEDPDPHPPSYEEAVFMDRMTQSDPSEIRNADSDSDEDETFQAELHHKIARMDSAGRATDVIEEEEEEDSEVAVPKSMAPSSAPSTSNGSAGRSNGSAPKFNTKL